MSFKNKMVAFFESAWIVVIGRILALIAFVAVALYGVQYSHYTHCVTNWADSFSSSTAAARNASNIRADALDTFLVDALANPNSAKQSADLNGLLSGLAKSDEPTIQKYAQMYADDLVGTNNPKLQTDTLRYIAASKQYQETVQTHPLPPAPKLVCSSVGV